MIKHKGTQSLQTERITLRKFISSDADSMLRNYAADPRVTKFLNWEPYKNVTDLEKYIAMVMKEYEEKSTYHWALEVEKEVIGSISVVAKDENNHSCEIGYCIGYDSWNKGFTSEALSAVIEFLFTQVQMHRIIAKHDTENPASGEVMKKCNMAYEGILRDQYYRGNGRYSDAILYAIVNNF